MSTRVGTLQAPRAGGSILLATFLASLVMLTIAMVAISFDQGQQGETTFVGRQHVVNTPSELGAGFVGGAEQTFVGGTAANTPSELNAQARLELGIRHTSTLVTSSGLTPRPSCQAGSSARGFPAWIYDSPPAPLSQANRGSPRPQRPGRSQSMCRIQRGRRSRQDVQMPRTSGCRS